MTTRVINLFDEPIDSASLQQAMTRLQRKSNVVIKETGENDVSVRSRIRKPMMRCHSFRKIFNTICIKNNVNHSVKEKLMGHKTKLELDFNYFRPTEQHLINEYLKVIPDLTIDQTHVLQKQVDQLQQQDDYYRYQIDKQIKEIKEENKILNQKLIIYNQRVKYNRDVDKKIDDVINSKIEERHLNTEYESIPPDDPKQKMEKDSVYKKLLEAREKRIKHENEYSKLLRARPDDELD